VFSADVNLPVETCLPPLLTSEDTRHLSEGLNMNWSMNQIGGGNRLKLCQTGGWFCVE